MHIFFGRKWLIFWKEIHVFFSRIECLLIEVVMACSGAGLFHCHAGHGGHGSHGAWVWKTPETVNHLTLTRVLKKNIYLVELQRPYTTDFSSKGSGLEGKFPQVQGSLGWWNIIIWPDIYIYIQYTYIQSYRYVMLDFAQAHFVVLWNGNRLRNRLPVANNWLKLKGSMRPDVMSWKNEAGRWNRWWKRLAGVIKWDLFLGNQTI